MERSALRSSLALVLCLLIPLGGAADEPLLTVMGRQHHTDKVSHGFTQLYDSVLGASRQSVRRVLEVGVFFGSSLRMWRDFFPNAVVVGLDHFQGVQGWTNTRGAEKGRRATFTNPDAFLNEWRAGKHARIELVVGNQSDAADMRRVVDELRRGGPFDLIVEDGSHLSRDQQRSFAALFPLLAARGVYIMEDLHCSMQSGYDEPRGGPHTSLRVMQKLNRTGRLSSRHLAPEEAAYLEAWVERVEIFDTKKGWALTGIATKRAEARAPS
jgi:predicted O-methyltransferase YrrM